MPDIRINKNKIIHYLEFCPFCNEAGTLLRLPVGTFWNNEDERKLRVPIHKKCWRKRNMQLIVFPGFVMISTIIIWLYYFPDTPRLVGVIIALVLFAILRFFLPTPIEFESSLQYDRFAFRSEAYAREFMKLNKANLWDVVDK